MKDVFSFYKTMFKFWPHLLLGFLTMVFYALFSGISVTMAIPLFDYVFTDNPVQPLYNNFYSFFNRFIEIFNPYFDKYSYNIFDKEILSQLSKEYIHLLKVTDPFMILQMISAIMIFLIILKNLFYYLNKLTFSTVQGKTIMEVRNTLYKKYLTHSLSFYNSNSVGDALVRIYTDAQVISDHFITSFFNLIRDIILIVVYARIALFLSGKLFFYSLIILPIFSLFISYFGRKIKKYAKRLQNQSSHMFSSIEEILNAIKVVKVFNKEEAELNKFKNINNNYYRFWRKSIIYGSFNVPLSELNGVFTGVIILLLGGVMVLNKENHFTFGEFSSFLFAIFSMLHPIKEISKSYTDIKKAMVSLRRVNEILDVQTAIVDDLKGIEKKDFQDKIEFSHVYFAYNDDNWVLKNISLTISKGMKIALVGNSGSGKTTLSNLLPRLFDIQKGDIKIDGIPIQKIRLKYLRSLFGIVTQESILFKGAIKENIQYGSNVQLDFHQIEKAAEIAYATEFINTLPQKYDTMLSNKASNLSGGQKQRLCIARAIAGEPPILIFDEATSALDTIAESKVQKAIEQATKNRTVILIAHRLSTILSCDKIVVFDKGEIVGVGSNAELLLNCPQYQKLYELQFIKKD